MIDSKKIIEEYISKKDWEVKENASTSYTFGALSKRMTTEVSKDYWLNVVYPKNISTAHHKGLFHIHDLGGLTLYCCGYSLQKVISMGVQGVPNIPSSSPAKHFDSILNQMSNLITIFQNEIMGAVAFSSFDTLLAPFVKKDNLNYKEIKQALQNFIFSINSNSRIGAEPAFSNLTFDLNVPDDLANDDAIIGGEIQDFKYKDCQKEIDLIDKAFCELMIDGDSNHKGFAYPIPTFSITKDFDWDNPKYDLLFEMAGKYGYPYFSNFVNTDMKPSDVRSMCCRLRLDLTELRRKNGGLFGSGDSTGSIGVVTLSLPKIGYETKNNKKEFYKLLDTALNLAKDSLEIKREWLQKNIIDTKLIPAFCTYVGTIDNHFSTIGVVGMNEMCENFFGEGIDITTDIGHKFAIEVGNHIRSKLIDFQKETGHLYNYEATPAESTCYRLAIKNRKEYPDIICRGTKEAPYYTNSCNMAVSKQTSIKKILDNQDELQTQFTGGTVVHIWLNGAISGEKAKNIIRTACENYKMPYIDLSPLTRYCPDHGYISDEVSICPICGKKLEKYQKITGYIRPVNNFNPGKKSEFDERVQL